MIDYDEDDWKELICNEIIEEIEAGDYPFDRDEIKNIISEKIDAKHGNEELNDTIKKFLVENIDELEETIISALDTDFNDFDDNPSE